MERAGIALLLADERRVRADAEPRARAGLADDAGLAALTALAAGPASPATAGEALLTGRALRRSFGELRALSDVSLRVRAGEVIGLIGGNGAGKTTLIRLLLGLDRPDSGTGELFGRAPDRLGRSRLGSVPQGLGLAPTLSAAENLRFVAAAHRIPVDPDARRAAAAWGATPVARLPLGARRLVALAAATQHRPQLLVLDEPTSGLDALSRARLWRALRAGASRGTGVLVSTHDMGEAAQCDRLILLAAGRVVATGTGREITAGRRSLLVRAERWAEAVVRLRASGIPVLLHGRTLRLPGAEPGAVARALRGLSGRIDTAETGASLEETMMLAQGRAVGGGLGN